MSGIIFEIAGDMAMSYRVYLFVILIVVFLLSCGDSRDSDYHEYSGDGSSQTQMKHEDHDDEDDDHHDDHNDHHDGDHGSLDAHEHGSAEASVVIERNTIEVEIIAPLANFGFAESGDAVPSSNDFANFLKKQETLVDILDGDCTKKVMNTVSTSGGHAEGILSIKYFCKEMPTQLEFKLLKSFSEGFEDIDVIIISDHGQEATELDSSRMVLDLH